MATSDELMNGINATYEEMQEVKEDLLAIKAEILEAPCTAATALEKATEAKATAETAQTSSEEALTKANNALPKTGGIITGQIAQQDNSHGPFLPGQVPQAQITSDPFDYLIPQSELENGQSANVNTFSRIRQNSIGDLILERYLATKNQAGTQLYNALYQGFDKNFKKFLKTDSITDGADPNQLAQVGYIRSNYMHYKGGIITIHVGGDNASDTADLYDGRGLSADKPFATLAGAISFVESHYSIYSEVNYVLHTDQTLNQKLFFKPHFWISIRPSEANARRTITLGKDFDIFNVSTCVNFTRIDFVSASDRNSVMNVGAYYHPIRADFYACSFTGNNTSGSLVAVHGSQASVTVRGATTLNGPARYGLYCDYNGSLALPENPTVTINGDFDQSIAYVAHRAYANLNCNFSGNPTGKRYEVKTSGYLYTGGKTIPGTIDGTCSGSGIYE